MAETAIELKKGDSRLGAELTDAETLYAAGIPSWESWATFEADRDPGYVWQRMTAHEANAAMPFYRDMELKDGHYSSQLSMRKAAVLSKTWRMNPTGSGEKVADFIEDTLWGIRSFEHVLREMLDALGKGVSVQETLYALDGSRLVISEIKARPQEAFAFNESGKPPVGALRLTPAAASAAAVSGTESTPAGLSAPLLPANKFVVTTFEMQQGNRWGNPLARRCFWLHWFKRQDVKFWLKFIEKGTGTVVAKYPQGADDTMKQQALAAARGINRTTAVAISEQFEVELLEKARAGGGAGEVFARLVEDHCNTEMSLVVRGQTLTARGGDQGSGSMALGEVHERASNLLTEFDAKMLMEAVQQQIVDPLTALNFGPDVEPPEFIIEYEEGEDLNKFTERMEKATKMVEVPKSYIRETLQLPEPDAGEEVVEPPAASAVDPNAGRDPKQGGKPNKKAATNLAEPGSTGEPAGADPGDPEPRVIEQEARKQAREMYGDFISSLLASAGKEIKE